MTTPPWEFSPYLRNMVGRNFFVKIFFDVWYLAEKGTPPLENPGKKIHTPPGSLFENPIFI